MAGTPLKRAKRISALPIGMHVIFSACNTQRIKPRVESRKYAMYSNRRCGDAFCTLKSCVPACHLVLVAWLGPIGLI